MMNKYNSLRYSLISLIEKNAPSKFTSPGSFCMAIFTDNYERKRITLKKTTKVSLLSYAGTYLIFPRLLFKEMNKKFQYLLKKIAQIKNREREEEKKTLKREAETSQWIDKDRPNKKK